MKIEMKPMLSERTTLRLGGKALAEIVVEQTPDLEELSDVLDDRLERLGGRPVVLGEGSNILAADQTLELVLIRLTAKDRPAIVDRNQGHGAVRIRVSGGMRLPRLLGWCLSNGFHGLEQWTGIPGSVGGAVAMNAGSYGLDMAQVLERVLIWTPGSGGTWRDASMLRFSYRDFDSGLDDPVQLVLAVELRVRQAEPGTVLARMRQWYDRKRQSQPVTMASAGCVFKNPDPEKPAGKMLEQVGLRGFRRGNMAFSDRHANFLVNLGGGKADDAFALLDLARERVASRFALELETEVKVLQ